ncbi:phosphoethanolamine transferase [uncultured Selenomonas sp.]|uniref:phosphoethanolamine transferase n=1 Tax=uncultured Selenomonas sp. TaxID=159275 RepID=UPI0025D9C928|nr:phosphoethanolamine transferase [uncultured Selenomonas sp.]
MENENKRDARTSGIRILETCRRGWRWFVEDNLEFLGLMLLFHLPYCSIYSVAGSWSYFVLHSFAYLVKLFFGLSLIAVFVSFLRPRLLRQSVRALLVLCTGLVCVAETFFISRYGMMPDAAIMEIVIATNVREAMEFFRMYVCNLQVAAGGAVGGVTVFAVWYVLHRMRGNLWVARILAVCFVGSLALSAFLTALHPELPLSTKLMFWPTRYFSIGYAANETIRAANDLSAYEKILRGHTDDDIVLTRNDDDLPYVIFIQGESTSRHHMGIYSYPLDTTPRLKARERNGELEVFTDVVSPHSHTMPVLEKLFTFYRYGMPGAWYEQHNLFDVLHVAGVHTAWLSNQESSGIYGNAGRVYAAKCNLSQFTMRKDSSSVVRQKYDEALLPLLDETLASDETAENHFYVLHLMGTHGGYADRYPPAFEKFHASDETVGNAGGDAKKIRAEYDNAVLYNDFIVDEIIRRFEDKDAIVIYVSDHADEVMEDREYAGHDETKGTHWMIEIPMIVWMSQTFRELHPDRAEAVHAAVDRPYMTDDMIHSLLDMMHVETTEYRPECSIFNEKFDASRDRIYAGKVYRKGDE